MEKNLRLRLFVMFFNTAVAFIGILFASLGSFRLHRSAEYGEYNNTYSLGPAIDSLIIGMICFVASFFGMYGTVSRCVAKLWAACVLYMVIFTLAICFCVIFAYGGKILPRRNLVPSVLKYHTSERHKRIWDEVHEEFMCCGIDGPMDYFNWGLKLPDTCCSPISIPDRAVPNLNCSHMNKLRSNLKMYGCYTPLMKRAMGENMIYVVLGFVTAITIIIGGTGSIMYIKTFTTFT